MSKRTEDRITLRIVLYKGEVCRLPRNDRGLVVLDGVAWITRDGVDRILRAGESDISCGAKFATVVSAVDRPLVIEVLGANHPRSPVITDGRRYSRIAGGNVA